MQESKDPLVERARERVGMTLKDKWKLDDLLGVGGMAAVYSATHRNGMRVAVKMLHPELSLNNEVRTRFLREGYVANRVEHSGAVLVLDDEVAEDGGVFLVMELLDGETLASRFERKARSFVASEVLLVADQVLDVLSAAHQKQIVHRDIKPDNIFLTRSGGLKLLDFGIARLRELSTKSSATRSGSTMGTPAYMAPEQARARWDEVDARTDLWSVGATMFKLLTGRVVHVAETVTEQLLAAMTQPAPPIASLVPTAPIPLVEIVDKALAFNKEDRWDDARHMQQAVRGAYKAITGMAPTSVRFSFADSDSRVSQADTVAAASKVPTSLSVARDSASFRTRRPRSISVIGALVLLGAVAAAGAVAAVAFRQPRPVTLESLFGAVDGGWWASAGSMVVPETLGSAAAPPPPLAIREAPPAPAASEGVGNGNIELPPAGAPPPEQPPAGAPDPAASLASAPPSSPDPPPAGSAPPNLQPPLSPWLGSVSSSPAVVAAPAALRPAASKPAPARKSVASPPTRKRPVKHHKR
jgi:serine/threonine-protein kinase